MMRGKAPDGRVDGVFDVRSTLVDRALRSFGGNLDVLELIQLFKNSRICAERRESGVIGMSRLVGLLSPLNRRLNGRGRYALRNIDKIDDGYPCARTRDHRLHES